MRVLWAYVVLTGCGELADLPSPDAGRPCVQDVDCVPNGCCGEAISVTHRLDAPDCSATMCSGMCLKDQVRCGCGLPLCRDSRCVMAQAVDPKCG
jgi:hypothetical protein